MAQGRYYKPGGGRFRPVPGSAWFYVVLVAAFHLFVVVTGILVLAGALPESQWILDRWPYPTPKP